MESILILISRRMPRISPNKSKLQLLGRTETGYRGTISSMENQDAMEVTATARDP